MATLLGGVATCCDILGVVGSNLKLIKFFIQHLWMFHDVLVVWPTTTYTHGCSLFIKSVTVQNCGLITLPDFILEWVLCKGRFTGKFYSSMFLNSRSLNSGFAVLSLYRLLRLEYLFFSILLSKYLERRLVDWRENLLRSFHH